jgi:hypothetical protein
LRVDYIPPGKYFWEPFFEQGKEQVHDDVIFADTKEEVLAEVQKRYPDIKQENTGFSDGLLGLQTGNLGPESIASSYDLGDEHFGVGHRRG